MKCPLKKWKLYSTGNWMLRAVFQNPHTRESLGATGIAAPHQAIPWSSTSLPARSHWILWPFCCGYINQAANTTLSQLKFFLSCPSFVLLWPPLCMGLYMHSLNPNSKRVEGAEISPTVGYPRILVHCLCQFSSISERNKDELLKARVFVSCDNVLFRHALSHSATWFPPLHNWYRPFGAFGTNLLRFINCTLVYNSCFERTQSTAIQMFSMTTPWFSLSTGPRIMTVVLIICWKIHVAAEMMEIIILNILLK